MFPIRPPLTVLADNSIIPAVPGDKSRNANNLWRQKVLPRHVFITLHPPLRITSIHRPGRRQSGFDYDIEYGRCLVEHRI